MRRAIFRGAACVVASMIVAGGCGHGHQTKNDTRVGTATVTSVTSAPAVGEREPSTSFTAVSTRMATEICAHETRCGRPQDDGCIDAEAERARNELMSWSCEPADTRARAEQCLAGIIEESCELNLTMRTSVCPVTVGCTRRSAR